MKIKTNTAHVAIIRAKNAVKHLTAEQVATLAEFCEPHEMTFIQGVIAEQRRHEEQLRRTYGAEMNYVITLEHDGSVFWSNANGWGDRASADTFTQRDSETLALPSGGIWVGVVTTGR